MVTMAGGSLSDDHDTSHASLQDSTVGDTVVRPHGCVQLSKTVGLHNADQHQAEQQTAQTMTQTQTILQRNMDTVSVLLFRNFPTELICGCYLLHGILGDGMNVLSMKAQHERKKKAKSTSVGVGYGRPWTDQRHPRKRNMYRQLQRV